MGAAHAWFGDQPVLHLSNMGPRTTVALGSDHRTDIGERYGVDELVESDNIAMSWGVVAFDFDRNRLDDLYIVRGFTFEPYVEGLGEEPRSMFDRGFTDLLAMQRIGDGEAIEFDVAEAPRPSAFSGFSNGLFHGRGAFLADVELDGTPDVVVYGADMRWEDMELDWTARVTHFEIDDATVPPVCTVIPRPWLVRTAGTEIELRERFDDHWRQPNVGGQINVGTSPWLLSAQGAGDLRFPSGAVVPFDCDGTPGPVEVFEPIGWMSLADEPDRATVCVDISAWGSTPQGATMHIDGEEIALVPTSDDTGSCWRLEQQRTGPAMVRFDDRWVPYRWPL